MSRPGDFGKIALAMKKPKPTKTNPIVLNVLCKFIPCGLVRNLAKKHGCDEKARTFSPWSHVVSMLYAHLTHAFGLNDVCDNLRHHAAKLFAIREAVPPSRNTLSHANKGRSSEMAKDLFWAMMKHLKSQWPQFGKRYPGLSGKFKKAVHAMDSSTIELVADCISWAKHRRKKAAAKLHLLMSLQTFLPEFVVIEEASHHDNTRAIELCAGLKDGEIVVFDKAYVCFDHLRQLDERGVFFVTRAKDNMQYRVKKRLQKKPKGNILRDDLIVLKNKKSRADYPQPLRLVTAIVKIDDEEKVMTFLTNNIEWKPSSVAGLYRSRWGIEVFFKQIKQTLKLNGFLGQTKNAIQWQIWTALLLYLILRFLDFNSRWCHSFTRLFAIVRGVLWDRFNIFELLDFYGTAWPPPRMTSAPFQPYLPGLQPNSHGTAPCA